MRLPEVHLAPLSEPAWCGSYWWVATVRRQAVWSLARYWWERKRERNSGRVNVGVCGRKKTSLSGLIHQIGPLNSPLDMIFRQTERECVNKNHGYMAYSLCPSVLTSLEITEGLWLVSIVSCFVSGLWRMKKEAHAPSFGIDAPSVRNQRSCVSFIKVAHLTPLSEVVFCLCLFVSCEID